MSGSRAMDGLKYRLLIFDWDGRAVSEKCPVDIFPGARPATDGRAGGQSRIKVAPWTA
jgi:hypothetical protein